MTLKDMQRKWKPRGWQLCLVPRCATRHKTLYADWGDTQPKTVGIAGMPRPQVYDIMNAVLEQMPEENEDG